MPDTDHVFAHITSAREACNELETHIADLSFNDFERVALLEGLAKIRRELKFLHYSAIPWTT
jgi:hypothetical protein